MAAADGSPTVTLGVLIDGFGRRAFGMMVVVATLPAFIPSPIGAGAIAGPLIVFLGLQMLVGRIHPWLPRSLNDRELARATVRRFLVRLGHWLVKIERVTRPRADAIANGAGWRVTGLLMAGHGVALSLPVPLTNYPFGFVLIILAIALIEGDGAIVAACWVLMLISMVVVAGFGGFLIELAQRLLA